MSFLHAVNLLDSLVGVRILAPSQSFTDYRNLLAVIVVYEEHERLYLFYELIA